MLRLAMAAAAFFVGQSATAATLTVMSGNDDCFGTNAVSCDDGAILSVAGPFNNSIAGDNVAIRDPAGQDQFGVLGTTSFDFAIDPTALSNALSATFLVKVFGLDLVDTGATVGDAFEGARILLNGADVALYSPPANIGQTEVEVLTVAIDVTALTPNSVFSIVPEEAFELNGTFEDYAVDFAKLNVSATDERCPSAC